MTERSVLAYDAWMRAQEKFDYFILGVIGVLCAYLSQNINSVALGPNAGTIELIALTILVGSAIAGFFRLEATITLLATGHQQLSLSEKKGSLVSNFQGGQMINKNTGQILTPKQVAIEVAVIEKELPEFENHAGSMKRKAIILYKLRNYLLLSGFLLLVVAKLLAAYELTYPG